MLRSLFAKLVLVLFLLLCVTGTVLLVSGMYSAHMYQQEVSQKLNRELASYIAREHVLIEQGRIRQDNLKELFHRAMIINPSLELYLLDAQGHVLAHSDELDNAQSVQVSLQPVQALLAGGELPIMGDDPQQAGRHKVFSAAPIMQDGAVQGYIYAILGSEQVSHVSQLLQNSYILKWSSFALALALLLSFGAGLLIFYLLTRRLATLKQSMDVFRASNFENPPEVDVRQLDPIDDIDSMTLTFQQMARRIHSQMTNLQQTDSLRRELVANVSHDLRTPLSSLKGYLETLLLKDAEISEQERRSYLEIAHRHADRLSRLVIELFELAKLEANEIQPQLESFSLAELVFDVAQKFQLRAQQKQIEIRVEVEADIPFVDADLGMIERVLDNLIDNALRHTPANGVVRLQLIRRQDQVDVLVADTGHGIEADELPHIFKRFYRKGESVDGVGAGAGLGLAIAHRIVELHGSTLSVSSYRHQGTVFEFQLPAHSFA